MVDRNEVFQKFGFTAEEWEDFVKRSRDLPLADVLAGRLAILQIEVQLRILESLEEVTKKLDAVIKSTPA